VLLRAVLFDIKMFGTIGKEPQKDQFLPRITLSVLTELLSVRVLYWRS